MRTIKGKILLRSIALWLTLCIGLPYGPPPAHALRQQQDVHAGLEEALRPSAGLSATNRGGSRQRSLAGEEGFELKFEVPVSLPRDVEISPDGKVLLTSRGRDGRFHVWLMEDPQANRQPKELLTTQTFGRILDTASYQDLIYFLEERKEHKKDGTEDRRYRIWQIDIARNETQPIPLEGMREPVAMAVDKTKGQLYLAEGARSFRHERNTRSRNGVVTALANGFTTGIVWRLSLPLGNETPIAPVVSNLISPEGPYLGPPGDIAVGEDGTAYVLYRLTHQILPFDPDTGRIRTDRPKIEHLKHIHRITMGSYKGKEVLVVTAGHTLLFIDPLTGEEFGPRLENLQEPRGIAVDSENRLVVSQHGAHRGGIDRVSFYSLKANSGLEEVPLRGTFLDESEGEVARWSEKPEIVEGPRRIAIWWNEVLPWDAIPPKIRTEVEGLASGRDRPSPDEFVGSGWRSFRVVLPDPVQHRGATARALKNKGMWALFPGKEDAVPPSMEPFVSRGQRHWHPAFHSDGRVTWHPAPSNPTVALPAREAEREAKVTARWLEKGLPATIPFAYGEFLDEEMMFKDPQLTGEPQPTGFIVLGLPNPLDPRLERVPSGEDFIAWGRMLRRIHEADESHGQPTLGQVSSWKGELYVQDLGMAEILTGGTRPSAFARVLHDLYVAVASITLWSDPQAPLEHRLPKRTKAGQTALRNFFHGYFGENFRRAELKDFSFRTLSTLLGAPSFPKGRKVRALPSLSQSPLGEIDHPIPKRILRRLQPIVDGLSWPSPESTVVSPRSGLEEGPVKRQTRKRPPSWMGRRKVIGLTAAGVAAGGTLLWKLTQKSPLVVLVLGPHNTASDQTFAIETLKKLIAQGHRRIVILLEAGTPAAGELRAISRIPRRLLEEAPSLLEAFDEALRQDPSFRQALRRDRDVYVRYVKRVNRALDQDPPLMDPAGFPMQQPFFDLAKEYRQKGFVIQIDAEEIPYEAYVEGIRRGLAYTSALAALYRDGDADQFEKLLVQHLRSSMRSVGLRDPVFVKLIEESSEKNPGALLFIPRGFGHRKMTRLLKEGSFEQEVREDEKEEEFLFAQGLLTKEEEDAVQQGQSISPEAFRRLRRYFLYDLIFRSWFPNVPLTRERERLAKKAIDRLRPDEVNQLNKFLQEHWSFFPRIAPDQRDQAMAFNEAAPFTMFRWLARRNLIPEDVLRKTAPIEHKALEMERDLEALKKGAAFTAPSRQTPAGVEEIRRVREVEQAA